tara:strand:- start:107 stop:409 length:303 start_codon:yes stop_codon:yes gene_type:complete
MKTSIQLHDFATNSQLKDNFSYDGLVALFDYLEDYERDCGIEIDFDPVALRCEFTEYNDIKGAYENYLVYEDETELEMMEYLRDNTQVIEFETGIILQDF